MKFYRMCIISLMLTGTYLQADATKEPVCRSIVECDKLSHSIESQIDRLEKSDDPDYDKLDALQKQLLAVENQKQAEEKAKQAAYAKVSKKLDIIDDSLK